MNSAFSHGQTRRPPARPALRTDAVRKLPRGLLLLLCLAYILPGFVGRDPWRSDGLNFVVMWHMAGGTIDWLHPVLYGNQVSGGGWLAYWLGAWSIEAVGGWIGPVLASRLPFMLALWTTFSLTWYAAFHLARREAAQPVPPAFGPAIAPADYARAIADGVLLTLLASLGLLGRGHEASPQVLQLAAIAAILYGSAVAGYRSGKSAAGLGLGLLVLAFSGAGWLTLLAAAVIVISLRTDLRRLHWTFWLAIGVGAAAAIWAESEQGWTMRGQWPDWATLADFFRIGLWFTWPAWPLAAWALWRWRESLQERHLQIAWAFSLLALLGALALGNADTVFLLSLPPLAVLGGFALPVMRRGALAAIDWFALLFFSLLALVVWVLWIAMLTGWPPQPAANIARLAPGFRSHLEPAAVAISLLATVAWAAIVAWRTGRHRHPLWKGMVLSASGVTLIWVLVGSLWMPVLDYASTFRGVGAAIARAVDASRTPATPTTSVCLRHAGVDLTAQALIGYWSGLAFAAPGGGSNCAYRLVTRPLPPSPAWRLLWSGGRPGERDEPLFLYRQIGTAS